MTVIKEGYDNGAAYAEGAVVVATDVEEATGEMQRTNPASSTSTKTPSAYVDVSGPKQGHVFCGCCCDVRRATIAINIVSLVYFFVIAQNTFASSGFDDDSALKTSVGFTVFNMIHNVAAIVDAARFKIAKVVSNAVWLILGVIVRIVTNQNILFAVIDLVATCFFLYPHVVLIHEIKFTNTMSQETYRGREEQSCCCVSTHHDD